MNKLLFLLFVIFFFSCELTYEDNTRLLIAGQVNDIENKGIAAVPVEVYAAKRFDSDLVGMGLSDATGRIEIPSISPINANRLEIFINRLDSKSYLNDRISYQVISLDTLDNDLKIDLPPLLLEKIITLNLEITRNTNTIDTLQYSLSNKGLERRIEVFTNTVSTENYRTSFNGVLLPNENSIRPKEFRVSENDTINFSYSLINNGVIEEVLELVPVSELNETYAFEF